MARRWLILLLFANLLFFNCDGQNVIIKNGKGYSTIVVPQKTDNLTNKTAENLQEVLNKMTGVALPICKDSEEIVGSRILIGQTKWTDSVVSQKERDSLGEEGFILRKKGSDIALTGNGPYGTAYAASELFEQLGARWYMPGPLGEVIPKINEVKFDELDIRQIPSFALRWVGKDLDWNLKNKTNCIKDDTLPPAYRIEPQIYHTQEQLIPHSLYYKTHPEFFSLIDGKRCPDLDSKLCNSNPQLPKEIAKRMGEILRANPGIDMISLSPTDHQKWCECGKCKALDEANVPRDQRYSRRQMVLYNRVAEELEKEFPKTLLLIGAYNVYNWPPKDPNIKAHHNLAVVICHYDDYCMAHPVNDPNCKRNGRYRELLGKWQKHTPHICFYEYYWKGIWLDMSWPIVHTVAVDIPYFKEMGYEGLYTQYTTENIWSNFLVHYVAAKLLWDHTTDVDALLEEFYVKFYGKAAGPMKEYYELLEKQMAECGVHTPGDARYAAARVFTPKILKKMSEYYQQSNKLAEDELVKSRLERIGCSLEYTKKLVKFFQLRNRAQISKGKEKIKFFNKALTQISSLENELANNASRYKGVASGRFLKLIGARETKKIQNELKKFGS
ncbi:MAG: DUF4838 domain-containing protein [Planctomycetota bacterium]|jgi:hypothetical protein